MIKNKWLYSVGLTILGLWSCNKNSEVKLTRGEINNVASFFPAPQGKWFGGSDPMYLAGGWVGDVMPYFEKDTFHVFYLHDARNGAQGFHPWAKFTTTDLVHYHNDGIMIPYGKSGDHDLALGTGSVIKIGDTYYAYYSGVNGNLPTKDVIMLATSNDLKHWNKDKDFIIYPETGNGYDKMEFRDPYVFFNKEKNEYWMLVCGRKDGESAVMLYTCNNPAVDNSWQLQNSIYTDADYYVPECPQIFKWGDYWYLIFSDNTSENVTHYRIATSSAGPWQKPQNDIFDGQYMYASKVAIGNGHTYLFGWVPTKAGSTDYGIREWGGNLVVHELKQNSDGTLNITASKSVEDIFTEDIPLNVVMKQADIGQSGQTFSIKKSSGDAIVLFDRVKGERMITATVSELHPDSKFGFIFGMNEKTESKDYYKIEMNVDSGKISGIEIHDNIPITDAVIHFTFDHSKSYQLKVFIDGSVCVVYLDDKVALTSRIYALDNNYWGVFSTDGSIKFENVQLLKTK